MPSTVIRWTVNFNYRDQKQQQLREQRSTLQIRCCVYMLLSLPEFLQQSVTKKTKKLLTYRWVFLLQVFEKFNYERPSYLVMSLFRWQQDATLIPLISTEKSFFFAPHRRLALFSLHFCFYVMFQCSTLIRRGVSGRVACVFSRLHRLWLGPCILFKLCHFPCGMTAGGLAG